MSPAPSFPGFAIHPDGPLYFVEATTGGGAHLVGVDIGLGAGRRVALPMGTLITCVREQIDDPQTCSSEETFFGAGVPTVLSDARVVVPVVTGVDTRCLGAFCYGPTEFHPALQLLFVRPDGTTSVQTVFSDWVNS